jgi:leucyl aminopeptidase
MRIRLSSPLTRSLAAAALLAASLPVLSAPVWISLGDDGMALLTGLQPQVRSEVQRDLSVGVPLSTRGPALRQTSERVHLVQIDETLLDELSEAIHQSLRHCGGYMVHASRAEGIKALDQTQQSLQAQARADAKISYVIDNQDLVAPMVAQVQDSQILSTIQTLSDYTNRYYATSHGVAASNGLFNTWKTLAAGRTDITVKQYTHAGWPMKSVILSIKGSTKPKEIVVVGGHLDSIVGGGVNENTRAPGADDDASGIASITEALRVLIANGYKPRRTLEFMAYAAEEVGLLGSNAIATEYKAKAKKVVGVMQLDMTNYKGSASDIFIYTDYTNAAQNDFLARLAATYLPTLKIGYDRCGYGCSDHASWTAKGYPASLPFEASFHQYDPYIHTANDTLANTGNQAVHAAKFSKLALAFAVELASDGPAPAIARKAR